jgi:hypothetical protein
VPRAATLSLLLKAEALFDDMEQHGRPTPELCYRKAWMLIQFARNCAILGDTGKQVVRANEAYRLRPRSPATRPIRETCRLLITRSAMCSWPEGSFHAYRDSLAIAKRLATADPGNAGRQRDLSVSYNKVGGVLVAQGNLSEALQAYRDDLAIAERLAKTDPGSAIGASPVPRIVRKVTAREIEGAERGHQAN